jgi:hypothetical protein
LAQITSYTLAENSREGNNIPNSKGVVMINQTVTLAELKEGALEKILQDVADQQVIVTVRLPDGKEVKIAPQPSLQPLPELEGQVPAGWKDAVYARG